MLNNAVVEGTMSSTYQKLLPWFVCFSAALFFFYEFIQMNMFNAISSDLMRDFGIRAGNLGYLSATYLLGDVLFLLPAGMLLDRLSVRKVIISAMLLCISGTYFFSITNSIFLAGICHFAAGIGNAFSFLSCIMLASRWFPPRRMALVTGLIVTFAMAGGVAAQAPLTFLAEAVGWRQALVYIAILGVVILGLILLVVRDYPPNKQYLREEKQKNLQALGFFNSLKLAFSNLQNWLCGVYTSLLNLPIMLLGALWGSMHLVEVHHLSHQSASYVTSMIFVGTIVGAPVIGWLSDRLCLRRMPMIIFGVFSLTVILPIIYIPNLSFITLIILYFLLGFMTSAQVISYPTIAESNPKVVTGTAMGLASLLIMGGGAVSQPLFGYILDLGGSKIVNGLPWYSATDFNRALLIIPIAFVIALLAAWKIRETHCLPIVEAKQL